VLLLTFHPPFTLAVALTLCSTLSGDPRLEALSINAIRRAS
jgi:hypothetical protein